MNLQMDGVLGVLGRGLQDKYSIEVKVSLDLDRLCFAWVRFSHDSS